MSFLELLLSLHCEQNRKAMKKSLIYIFGALLLLNSCGSYEATGAYTGAQFGSVIGSAIGGITGGWRGSNIGQLAGMAGGAVVGAAVGAAADKKAEERAMERSRQIDRRNSRLDSVDRFPDDEIVDGSNSGDDRVFFDGLSCPRQQESRLVIQNVRFVDDNHDGMLVRGEDARIVFEIHNASLAPAFRVQPMVMEATGNKHVFVSQNVMVESIQPEKTIRYTARVKTDNRLKTGEVVFNVGLMVGGAAVPSQSYQLRIPTGR